MRFHQYTASRDVRTLHTCTLHGFPISRLSSLGHRHLAKAYAKAGVNGQGKPMSRQVIKSAGKQHLPSPYDCFIECQNINTAVSFYSKHQWLVECHGSDRTDFSRLDPFADSSQLC